MHYGPFAYYYYYYYYYFYYRYMEAMLPSFTYILMTSKPHMRRE